MTQNCRNSAPIAGLARGFYPLDSPSSVVPGQAPAFEQFDQRSDLIVAALGRVKRLCQKDGFSPNQLLVVTIGFNRSEIEKAAQRNSVFVEATGALVRFPLTPKDVRVVYGTPDEVQGLEADVVVVAHWAEGESFPIGAVRDFYVSTTRARSLLYVLSNFAESELATLASLALAAETTRSDVETSGDGNRVG